MITGIVFLLILITVQVRGGDLTRMATIRPRRAWMVALAILLQVAIISVFASELPFAVASALHLASYGLALAFVWTNRHIGGIRLTVLGGVLNLVAIVANGGVMPASSAALEFAGKPVSSAEFENSTTRADAELAVLGDVFALPDGMPFANVFSIGDILLLVGGYFLVSRACLDTGRSVAESAAADHGPLPESASTAEAIDNRVPGLSVGGAVPVTFAEASAGWHARQRRQQGTRRVW